MIVDLDNDTPTSPSVVLTWLEIEKLFFLNNEKNFGLMHFSYLLWSFRLFSVATLISAFILFNNASHCRFGDS